jgi:aspartate aminotransferase
MVGRLNGMRNVVCSLPPGAIYAFPDISRTGYGAQPLAEKILESARVVVEAGSFYGNCGEGHLRLCFGAHPYELIEEAMNRLDKFFNALSVP